MKIEAPQKPKRMRARKGQYTIRGGQLAKQCTPVPAEDIWSAAPTLQFGPRLYSRDDHFRHFSQLPRL